MELTLKSALTEKLCLIMHLPSLINRGRHRPEHCVLVKESTILFREACLGCFQVERDAQPLIAGMVKFTCGCNFGCHAGSEPPSAVSPLPDLSWRSFMGVVLIHFRIKRGVPVGFYG